MKVFIKEKITDLFSDFKEFNKSEKTFLIGEIFFSLSSPLASILLPLLVKAITGSAALTGIVRMFYELSQGMFIVFSGEIVQRNPFKSTISITFALRAIIYVLIGILFLFNQLTLFILILLMSICGATIAFGQILRLGSVGSTRVFSSAQKIERASYLFTIFKPLTNLFVPTLVGYLIDVISSFLGSGISIFLFYIIYAVLMFSLRQVYMAYIVPIENVITPSTNNPFLLSELGKTLITFLKVIVHMPYRLSQTAKVIYGNKPIFLRTVLAIMESFVNDSLLPVILPAFALDVLLVGATGMGFLISANYLGALCAGVIILQLSKTLQKRVGFYRFVFYLACGSMFSFIPSIGLWAYPSIWVAAPMVFLMQLFSEPLIYRMRTMLQNEIKIDPKTRQFEGNIYSLIITLSTLMTVISLITFTWIIENSAPGTFLFALLGNNAVLKIVSLCSFILSFFSWIMLYWIKKHAIRLYPRNRELEIQCFSMLKTNLKLMGLTDYQTKTMEESISNDVAVAIFDLPTVDQLSILKESARKTPGNVHLVFDRSWFIQEMQADYTYRLFLKKGLVFLKDFQPVIITYNKPRLINYFANYREDGKLLEERLGIPLFSSFSLNDHSRLGIETMLRSAYRSKMKEKRLLIIGSGDIKNKIFFEKAQVLGLQLILIDAPDSWAKSFTHEYFSADLSKEEEALKIVIPKLLKTIKKFGAIHGITTFCDDLVIFTAQLAEKLQLPYHSVEASRKLFNIPNLQKALNPIGIKVCQKNNFDCHYWNVDLGIQAGKILYSWASSDDVTHCRSQFKNSEYNQAEYNQTYIELSISAVQLLGFINGVLHVNGQYNKQSNTMCIQNIHVFPKDFSPLSYNLSERGLDLIEMFYAIALQIPIIISQVAPPSDLKEEILLPGNDAL